MLNTRLTDVVREQLGESYSPSAYSYIRNDPDPVVETYVYITGAPDRIDAVGDLAIGEFADLAANGPTDREFDGALAQVREDYSFISNEGFIEELVSDAIWPSRSIDEYVDEYLALDDVSTGTVQAFIARHVPADHYVSVSVVPR